MKIRSTPSFYNRSPWRQNIGYIIKQWQTHCVRICVPARVDVTQAEVLLTWYHHMFSVISSSLSSSSAECGSSVINNEGILLSPNYPMNYDNNHECIYSIQVCFHSERTRWSRAWSHLDWIVDCRCRLGRASTSPLGLFILPRGIYSRYTRVHRRPLLEIQPGWSVCTAHHKITALLSLQIYDGKDNTAQILGAFTGSSMLGLTLISTSNHLWLEFYSDEESTGEGFKLVYSSELTA